MWWLLIGQNRSKFPTLIIGRCGSVAIGFIPISRPEVLAVSPALEVLLEGHEHLPGKGKSSDQNQKGSKGNVSLQNERSKGKGKEDSRACYLLRRPLAAQPVLGHEIDPVLGFEKRASFAADCCAPAMVCWLTLSMA